jgi:hypothetical protein
LTAGGIGFLACAALALYVLSKDRTHLAIMLLTAGSLWGVSVTMVGHDAFAQYKSSKELVKQVRPYIRPGMEIFSIHNAYDQTLPFYLRRPITLVNYREEFEFGENAEPGKAITSTDAFISRWRGIPSAMAMMDSRAYSELQRQGLAMQPVYRDARRYVVIKPQS